MRKILARVLALALLAAVIGTPYASAAGRISSASDVLSTLSKSTSNVLPSGAAASGGYYVGSADGAYTVIVDSVTGAEGVATITTASGAIADAGDGAGQTTQGATTNIVSGATGNDTVVGTNGIRINWGATGANLNGTDNAPADSWTINVIAGSAATGTIDTSSSNDGDTVVIAIERSGIMVESVFENDDSSDGTTTVGAISFQTTNAGVNEDGVNGLVTKINGLTSGVNDVAVASVGAGGNADDSILITTRSYTFYTGVNDGLRLTETGAVSPGDSNLSLITDGGLTSGTAYPGADVATAIDTALESISADGYTVTYDVATSLFSITNTGGSLTNIYWTESTAGLTLGYTADDAGVGAHVSDQAAYTGSAASNDVMTLDRTGTITVADLNDGKTSSIATAAAAAGNAGGNVATHLITFAPTTALIAGDRVEINFGGDEQVRGYTQSPSAITDHFAIALGTNDTITFTEGGAGTPGDLTATIPAGEYSGTGLAAAVEGALNGANDAADNDLYTVTYDAATDLFTIVNLGWDADDSIFWAAAANTAGLTIGFAADDNVATMVGDNLVAFNVLNGVNDTLAITLDGVAGGADIDIVAVDTIYTSGATLAAAVETAIATDANFDAILGNATPTAVVEYTSIGRFKISSVDFVGGVSSVAIAAGATDAQATLGVTADVPVAGTNFSNSSFRNLNAGDVVLYDETAVGDVSGAGALLDLSGDGNNDTAVYTLTAGAAAGNSLTLDISKSAAADATDLNATNPVTSGLYQIYIRTTDSAGEIKDTGFIAVTIVDNDTVTVSATVDPILSFTISSDKAEFGSLVPNSYHKLMASKSAYGSLASSGTNPTDGDTVVVDNNTYEFDDDSSVTAGNISVNINAQNASESVLNLYRAINSNDADVRANVDPDDQLKINIVATADGILGNGITLTGGGTFTATAFTATGVDSGNYQDTDLDDTALGTPILNGSTGTNLTISTNSAGGYNLTIASVGLIDGSNQITAWNGTYGYGFKASAQSSRYGDATTDLIQGAYNAYGAIPTSTTSLATNANTAGQDMISVDYLVRIDPTQAAGTYSDTVTYIATATY